MKRAVFIFILVFLTILSQGQIISTIAGTGAQGYGGDGGPASLATLKVPASMIFDKYGNLLIADFGNHVIRKINVVGNISTIAGIGSAGFGGDGGPAILAQLNAPAGICVDDSGNIFIAEQQGQRIRKINTIGVIFTYAGTGIFGYNGDGIPANSAQLGNPSGVVADKLGNLYITEFFNHRIRRVNTAGIISTIAGTGTMGYTGDGGQATLAQLSYPYGITIDDTGSIFFADHGNHCFRKISVAGKISTIAGTGTSGYSGDGGPAISANLSYPSTVAIDKSGNVYIADWWNNVIRKVTTAGTISTITGNGNPGYSGDGGLATAAQLNSPFGIALDTSCCLYIADAQNHVIRKVTDIVGVAEQPSAISEQLNIYPNPSVGSLFISYSGRGKQLATEIFNVYGQLVLNETFDIVNKTEVKIKSIPEGVYLVKLLIDGIHKRTHRIIVTK